MKRGALSDYFAGVGVKSLSGTEVDPEVSNGHEIQGINMFRKFIGDVSEAEALPVRFVWLTDEEQPVSIETTATWYDSRKNQPHRNPEYRFYYNPKAEEVVHKASQGDSLFLCKPHAHILLAVFCPSQSSIEQQLLWLFDLSLKDNGRMSQVDLSEAGGRDLDVTSHFILDQIGVDPGGDDDDLIGMLLDRFGEQFPTTKIFSKCARELVTEVDCISAPDTTLIEWVDMEYRMFRALESVIVTKRLEEGFAKEGQPDVDTFIRYSLSIQNTRKSRAGYALGNHVEELLRQHKVAFKREGTTEKKNAADFLFPSELAYHNDMLPDETLTMLAAKTSCKDRWRQVLAEANRIWPKHLVTLEPGISLTQTNEMRREKIQLVVPTPIHDSYLPVQRKNILSFSTFLDVVKSKETPLVEVD